MKLNYIEKNDAYESLLNLSSNLVTMVYLDPPFSTGLNFFSNTGELAFSDKYKLEELLLFLKPIIVEIKRVLCDNGTFFLHGDKLFIHYVKIMCDDIFGRENFRNEIIWHYNSGARKKKDFGHRHDTILRYTKTDNYIFNPIREPYSETAPRGYEKEKYYHPDGKVIDDVWRINSIAQNQKFKDRGEYKRYPTEKPIKLINRLVLSSTNENDIVLDPMFGSGGVLVTAKKNNRNYIGFDKSDVAHKIAEKRLNLELF